MAVAADFAVELRLWHFTGVVGRRGKARKLVGMVSASARHMLAHQRISTGRRRDVSAALSHYLGVGQDESFPRLELRRDLGLEPLDLVLFVLAFEETDGLMFPFEELERATTVGELIERVAGWLAAYDDAERLADEDDPFGKQSGSWPIPPER